MRTKAASRKPASSVTKIPAIRLLPSASLSNEEIAARAYQHYLERGMDHGHHVEDWLRAEQELQEELDGEKMAEGA